MKNTADLDKKKLREKREKELPILFPEGIVYDCISCPRCCKGYNIVLRPDEYERYLNADFTKEAEEKYPDTEVFKLDPQKGVYSLSKVNGHCIMLEDKKCIIHGRIGFEQKPITCQKFPFFALTPTPDGIYVGVSFACTAVDMGVGKELSAYEDTIKRWSRKHAGRLPRSMVVKLYSNYYTNWPGYKNLEEEILKAVKNRGRKTFEDLFLDLTLTILDLPRSLPEKRKYLKENLISEYFKSTHTLPEVDREGLYETIVGLRKMMMAKIEQVPGGDQKENYRLLSENKPILFRTFDREIDPAEVDRYRKEHKIDWHWDEFERYITHVIWRKFLVKMYDNVSSGLAALYTFTEIFDWYVYASAYARGVDEPEMEDVYFSIPLIEIFMAGHSWSFKELFIACRNRIAEEAKIEVE